MKRGTGEGYICLVGLVAAWGLLLPAGCMVQFDREFDFDHDGYSSRTDCDDTNESIHPSAREECGDGIDQNCDGHDSSCAEGEEHTNNGQGDEHRDEGTPEATDDSPTPEPEDTAGDDDTHSNNGVGPDKDKKTPEPEANSPTPDPDAVLGDDDATGGDNLVGVDDTTEHGSTRDNRGVGPDKDKDKDTPAADTPAADTPSGSASKASGLAPSSTRHIG